MSRGDRWNQLINIAKLKIKISLKYIRIIKLTWKIRTFKINIYLKWKPLTKRNKVALRRAWNKWFKWM
jgi:hypothetical protein